VRGTVAGLRETRWADLAGPFRTGPVAAGTARAAEAPEIYTGALPRPAKHRFDDGAESARPHFDRSAAAGGAFARTRYSARQSGRAHQELVDGAGAEPAFADRPDHQ